MSQNDIEGSGTMVLFHILTAYNTHTKKNQNKMKNKIEFKYILWNLIKYNLLEL